jgi:hypothetical protein
MYAPDPPASQQTAATLGRHQRHRDIPKFLQGPQDTQIQAETGHATCEEGAVRHSLRRPDPPLALAEPPDAARIARAGAVLPRGAARPRGEGVKVPQMGQRHGVARGEDRPVGRRRCGPHGSGVGCGGWRLGRLGSEAPARRLGSEARLW